MSDDLTNDIIRAVAGKIRCTQQDDNGSRLDGELSDAQLAAQKAAYEAEQKEKDVFEAMGLPKEIEDMLRDPDCPKDTRTVNIENPDGSKTGVIMASSLEDAIKELRKLVDEHDDTEYTDDVKKMFHEFTKPWSLSEKENDELERLLQPVGEFLQKHKLPSLIRIQTARIDKETIRMLAFKQIMGSKSCAKLGMLCLLNDILFSENLRKEEFEAIMDLAVSIYVRHTGGK